MLRLFSNIRQSMLSGNNTVKYFKYAVGEVLLIMLGIFLALQLDNWNEDRKLDQERRQLIENLKLDFAENISKLDDSIPGPEKAAEQLNRLLKLAVSKEDQVSVEEMRSLFQNLSEGVGYTPSLPSYFSAQSAGSIEMIEDTSLKKLFLEFDYDVTNFHKMMDIRRHTTFLGPWWELRSMVGAEGVLLHNRFTPEAYQLSDQEFRDFIVQKEVYARIENYTILIEIQLQRLKSLRDSSQQILTALEGL